MKACKCGNMRFNAHQRSYHDIVVDANNNFEKDFGIYESETPYGPYTCTKCGAEYESTENFLNQTIPKESADENHKSVI